jgi:hypothetical protein
MANIPFNTVAKTCTTLEERKEFAKLQPSGAKGYLTEKAEYALKVPKIIHVVLKDGSIVERVLLQIRMSAAIHADETIANYLWPYKAEVSFDMLPTRKKGGQPKPFLSSSNDSKHPHTVGPNRRHSLTPFPKGMTAGLTRRPDVIIVKDRAIRWPGLATTDHDGVAHPDNIVRVVEMKFPGDTLDPDQEIAYKLIAGGGVDRLCIVDVNDCNKELEKARRKLVPVRTTVPIAKAVFYEEWLSDLEHAIQPLWHDLKHGASQLSGEVQDILRREVAWLYSAGHWVQDAASKSYVYLNAQRQVLSRWTQEQLDAVWEQIVSFTDLTKAAFQRIEWMQIITHYAKDVAVFLVCLVIAGVIVVFAIPQALIAGLIALLGVLGLSAAAA